MYIIIAKGKVFNYVFSGALKLLFAFYAFKSFNMLRWCYTLTPIAPYIVFLLPIIYISPILKLFLLL